MGIDSNFGFNPIYSLSSQSQSVSADDKIKAFVENHCEGITYADAVRLINHGSSLATHLASIKTDQEWGDLLQGKSELGTLSQKDAVAFSWFLTHKTASQEELYTSGATRIAPGDTIDGQKLRQFFRACGGAKTEIDSKTGAITQKGGAAYGRISSHMKKDLKLRKGDTQYGMDIRPFEEDGKKYALPAGKRTILFDALYDKSFYLKFEEHGVPPFWRAGFRSSENVKEFLDHSVSYITGRKPIKKMIGFISRLSAKLSKLSSQKDGIESTSQQEPQKQKLMERKEHIPESIKDTFNKVISELPMRGSERDKYMSEAKQGGVKAMHRILNEKVATDKGGSLQNDIVKLKDDLEKRIRYGEITGYLKQTALKKEGNEIDVPANDALESEPPKVIENKKEVDAHNRVGKQGSVDSGPGIQGNEVLLASIEKLVDPKKG